MDDANQAARALADHYWEELLELEPLIGTMIGDERFDDKLPDPSEEGLARRADGIEREVSVALRLGQQGCLARRREELSRGVPVDGLGGRSRDLERTP